MKTDRNVDRKFGGTPQHGAAPRRLRSDGFPVRHAAWLMSLLLTSCSRPASAPRLVQRAEFGVLFGGQIEQRSEIPFCLDRTQQAEGFRITFGAPLNAPHRIRWRFDLPGIVHDRHGHPHPAHPPRVGEDQARVGTRRYDHDFAFRPGDPLGMWNARVMVDDQIVIDRPFVVYDAQARNRALDRLRDGG